MTKRENWEKMQAQYRDLDQQSWLLNFRLERRYGSAVYATRTERAKQEAARARMSKLSDRMLAWLDQHSPRDWRYGVPAHWVYSELTYEDATTAGPLSAAPPLAYGYTRLPELLKAAS